MKKNTEMLSKGEIIMILPGILPILLAVSLLIWSAKSNQDNINANCRKAFGENSKYVDLVWKNPRIPRLGVESYICSTEAGYKTLTKDLEVPNQL